MRTLHLTPADVPTAGALLRAGRLVVMPTETVYGLAANAGLPAAVAAVFTAKGRPADDPLIVHVSPNLVGDRVSEGLVRLGLHAAVDPAIDVLAAAFWPGPLTLVAPRGPAVTDAITAGLPDVAVRMPAHPVAVDLIDAAGVPLVAPSANRFGQISPTTAEHAATELDGRVDAILDGGPCAIGVESTVVRVGPTLQILRPGAVTADDLARVLDRPVVGHQGGRAASPGLLDRHYAPRTPMVLVDGPDDPRPPGRVGWLGWRTAPADAAVREVLTPRGDPAEAARHLYGALRRLDEAGVDVIVAEVCPVADGLGAALRDRMRRAAHRGR